MSSKNIKDSEGTQEIYTFEQIIYDFAGTIFFAFVILLTVLSIFLRQVTVDGGSMNDTLHDGDRLLVTAFGYTPKCGDIVVIAHGETLDEPIIKRVIATEGQTLFIDYDTGEVVVDGVLLKEYYIKGTTGVVRNMTEIPSTIKEGYVFVMGDNREHSKDSRNAEVGLIPVENIVGKAFYRIYPFEDFGAL